MAAGAVDHEELVKQAEAAFGGVPDEDASSSVATLLAKVGGCRGSACCSHQLVWCCPVMHRPTDAAQASWCR